MVSACWWLQLAPGFSIVPLFSTHVIAPCCRTGQPGLRSSFRQCAAALRAALPSSGRAERTGNGFVLGPVLGRWRAGDIVNVGTGNDFVLVPVLGRWRAGDIVNVGTGNDFVLVPVLGRWRAGDLSLIHI